jgi:hypothetical protein
MSDATARANTEATPEEMMSALFAQLVVQQANLAMMLLGKSAHPETGHITKDLQAAKLFIDQLEMLEAKTKGNLTKEEAGLLKQSLMALRLAFVQAVEEPEEKSEPQPQAGPKTTTPAESPASPSASEPEHPKKFSKKY